MLRETPRRRHRFAMNPLLRVREQGFEFPTLDEGHRLVRKARAVRRLVVLMLWTLPAILIQSVCLILPGRAKIVFAQIYWAVFTRLLGFRVRVLGAITASTRPVVFVANHSSWVDVPVLGGVLRGCFVAKSEIAGWPLVNVLAWLGRTVFVSRLRGTTARERDAMRARLQSGDNLILFPEGTSSDGTRVLPFRTSFFAAAEASDTTPPLVQPVSVVYDLLGGLPTGRASRPLFAWYGDMDILTHFWRLGQHSGLRATVLLHAPLDPTQFTNRKALAQVSWQAVADGAATLRQNRLPRPASAVEPASHPPGDEPALAP